MAPKGLKPAFGRAGPVCRHAFARPYNSTVVVFRPFGHPGGTSERAETISCEAQGRHLSETAGADAFGLTLNPAPALRKQFGPSKTGPAIDGDETRVCARKLAPVWFEPRIAAGFQGVVLPGSQRESKRDGWSQPGGSRRHAGGRQTGKSLQWIERQKLSPSPNSAGSSKPRRSWWWLIIPASAFPRCRLCVSR